MQVKCSINLKYAILNINEQRSCCPGRHENKINFYNTKYQYQISKYTMYQYYMSNNNKETKKAKLLTLQTSLLLFSVHQFQLQTVQVNKTLI